MNVAVVFVSTFVSDAVIYSRALTVRLYCFKAKHGIRYERHLHTAFVLLFLSPPSTSRSGEEQV